VVTAKTPSGSVRPVGSVCCDCMADDAYPAAWTGPARKSFRPCSPRPVRSRDCFRCWGH